MNKNYKENLKKRYAGKPHKEIEHHQRLDFKEYKVRRDAPLLEYLIKDIQFSRNTAKSLLSRHLVSLGGAPISQFDFMLSVGDSLIISRNPIKAKARKDVPIIYEDDEFIAINKPVGLLSNASETEKNSTAYRMVMDYVQEKDKHNRIFLVHRLDKETSGVLMFCKNEKTRDELQESWNDLVTKRGYFAIVEGRMEKKEDTIINYLRKDREDFMHVVPTGGNGNYRAVTHYKVLQENKKYSLLDVTIDTGRKNQIRVTLGYLGHYVLGDDKYGEPENPINRLCLHAYELSFKHPETGKIYKFDAPTPKEFLKLMK
jgi:23S rRNA pseudouridine1911/1915/1917 synthase